MRVYQSSDTSKLRDLLKFDKYNAEYIQESSKNVFIFKCFYMVDASIRSVKKLYEEPERLKVWDPNIVSTKLLSYLQGNNSRIFTKKIKAIDPLPESQQFLINYSSDISDKNSYYLIE